MQLVHHLAQHTQSGNKDLPLHGKLNAKINNSPLSHRICYSFFLCLSSLPCRKQSPHHYHILNPSLTKMNKINPRVNVKQSPRSQGYESNVECTSAMPTYIFQDNIVSLPHVQHARSATPQHAGEGHTPSVPWLLYHVHGLVYTSTRKASFSSVERHFTSTNFCRTNAISASENFEFTILFAG